MLRPKIRRDSLRGKGRLPPIYQEPQVPSPLQGRTKMGLQQDPGFCYKKPEASRPDSKRDEDPIDEDGPQELVINSKQIVSNKFKTNC